MYNLCALNGSFTFIKINMERRSGVRCGLREKSEEPWCLWTMSTGITAIAISSI